MKGSLLKKGFAALAAFAVGVSGLALGVTTASAADGLTAADYGHSITVTGSANALKERSFTAIRLAGFDEGASLDVATESAVEQNVKNALSGTAYNASKDGDPMAWVAANLKDSTSSPYSGELRNFVTDLAHQLQGTAGNTDGKWSGYKATANSGDPDETGENVYTLNNGVTGGIYLIIDKAANGKLASNSIPILVGTSVKDVTNASGKVEVKNNVPPLEKTVTNQVIGKSEYANFKVTTAVPNYVGYQKGMYVFKIIDSIRNDTTSNDTTKIQFDDKFDLKVTIDGVTDPIPAQTPTTPGYELTKSAAGFTVDLSSYIESKAGTKTINREYVNGVPTPNKTATVLTAGTPDLTGKTVTLTYNALVTAEIGTDGAQNDVKLQYSNNPKIYDEGDTPTVTEREDHEKVFNVPLKIKKTDKTSGQPLSGAVFQIIDKDGTNLTSKNLTATSGADGLASFASLGLKQDANDKTKYESTFTVKEVTAPKDHVLPSDPTFKVKISATVSGTKENAELTDVKYEIVAGGGLQTFASVFGSGVASIVTVKNAKNITELPLTGAAGTALFTVIGLLLAGAAATVFAKSRRTSKALQA
ncbi:SpaA isopeptide-forming pilin-related protein [Bifidobacterium felsineum]|uniref:Uncharacterized protein n=1 Tax=Bifidobacterium felsineum TaxID=2045440 RepID=A0A2M9HLE6_9BIFI|nr:SpaA isopeptide-forming pilin-related protein [Bifidobacterium felsineum]MBT1163154.1 LPXTG cell wall anchor domain-containing protein [Bifidobacterium felsineum]PJM77634.1 hypothetical protein CSQ86_00665 [Bifidobacterium felsineum]